jgi:hypothetical protein
LKEYSDWKKWVGGKIQRHLSFVANGKRLLFRNADFEKNETDWSPGRKKEAVRQPLWQNRDKR